MQCKNKFWTNFCGLPEIITTEKHPQKVKCSLSQGKEIFNKELQEWRQILSTAFEGVGFLTCN